MGHGVTASLGFDAIASGISAVFGQLPPSPQAQWNDWVLLAASLAVPYAMGNAFFSLWLFRDIQLRWGLPFASQVVFSSTLAVSFQVHILLLLMVSGLISPSLMGEVWRWDFVFFVVLLKVVAPCVLWFALIKNRMKSSILRWTGTALMESAWLALNFSNVVSLENEVEKLGFVGVASMAILSGWGSVAGPYQHLPWFRRAYSDEEIASADTRLQSVLDMVAEHKRKALISKMDKDSSRSRFVSRTALEEKVLALEALANELFLERVEMRGAKSDFLFAQTALGRFYTLAGYSFALYCVFRMGAAVWAIIFPRGPNDPDVVTRVISLLFFSLESRRMLAQAVSIILVGVMVFNSFRGLLLSLGKLFHQVGVLDSTMVSVLLTEVMGHYMLSSIVLLNLGLPPDYRFANFLRFNHFRRLFEVIYLLAALGSVGLIAVSDRAKRSRTEFYGVHNDDRHDKLI